MKKTSPNRNAKVRFDPRYCTGCGICVRFCPQHILEITDQRNERGYFLAGIKNREECDQCGNCELYCPDFAVFLVEEGDHG